MNIELVGGPHDGTRMTVRDGQWELLMYLPPSPLPLIEDDPSSPIAPALKMMTYAPITETDRLLGRWTMRKL